MTSAVSEPATVPIAAQPAQTASRSAWSLLILVGALVLIMVTVGRAWDRYWHATRIFDSFWSPPHVFVYSFATIAGLVVAVMAFHPRLRASFGVGFRVGALPFEIPGPLFLLGAGFVALGIAGMLLDNLWHTLYGLDETIWSLPHAMIAASLALVGYGLVASRLALRSARPLRWYEILILGFLLITISGVFLGPLNRNNMPETVQATATIPALLAQRAAQHTFRIYHDWNLTRSNPMMLVLGPLWAGMALALVSRLEPRSRRMLLIVLAWTIIMLLSARGEARRLDRFLPVMHDPASWLPLPLLPAALALVFSRRIGLRERAAFVATGITFGLCAALFWHMPAATLILLPLAGAAAAIGASAGAWVFRTITHPTELRSWVFVLLLVAAQPMLIGAADLYLRWNTL